MGYDFTCADHGGTVSTITPQTPRAVAWMVENIEDYSTSSSTGCPAFGEPKAMLAIAEAMIDAGLSCPNGDLLSSPSSSHH